MVCNYFSHTTKNNQPCKNFTGLVDFYWMVATMGAERTWLP